MKKLFVILLTICIFSQILSAQEADSSSEVTETTAAIEENSNSETSELKENEISQDIENPENKTEDSEESEEAEEADEKETAEPENVEKHLLDSYNRLRLFEFEKEIFIPKTERKKRILIHSNEKTVTRTFYDKKYRLVKKEEWDMQNKADSKLLKVTEYEYTQDNKNPSLKKETVDNIKTETSYNQNGMPSEAKQFLVEEKSSTLLVNSKWKYDEKNRIIEEQISEYSKNTLVQSKKQKYFYNKVDKENEKEEPETFPPDYEYYENGLLKIKTVYEKKGTWKNQIFFDDSYSVSTYYVDNKKTKDVYIQNGTIRRSKSYE